MNFWKHLVDSNTTTIARDFSAWINLEGMVTTGRAMDTFEYYAPAWDGADFIKMYNFAMKYLNK